MPDGDQQQQQGGQQQGDQQQQQQAAQPAWHGLPETDAAGLAYIANKGWKSSADVVKSYQSAEKLIGRDPSALIALPKADDAVGLRSVMSKLGLPETPEKYEFAAPPSGLTIDATYEKWARGTFHEIGIPAPMAKALTAKHNEFVAQAQAQVAKDYELSVAADKKALLSEWKGGHERMLNAAKTAAKTLGFTPEMLDGIERTVGYAGTWKFMAALGVKMGEDGFATSGDQQKQFGAQQTPDEARGEWEKMKIDPTTVAALRDKNHPGYKAAAAKKNALFQIMYPEG